MNTTDDQPTPGSPTGPGSWVAEAIQEQEEHIKRQASCDGHLGLAHQWDTFADTPGRFYQACWRCRVTKTAEDYRIKSGP